MKSTIKLFATAIIAVFMTSCAPKIFYQVYETTPSDKMIVDDNLLIYEDANCKVSYNFWNEGGNIGFRFYNKTDKDIFLDLEHSFFVLNGIAFDYYQNRIFSNSATSGVSTSIGAIGSKSVTGVNNRNLLLSKRVQLTNNVGVTTSSAYSTSYKEKKVECIPAKTSKIIVEYNIKGSLYRDCDLFKYPNKKQIKSVSFTRSESPIVFSNRIAYSTEGLDKLIKFQNEFYVNEISNYPESEIIDYIYDEFCGQKNPEKTAHFRNVSPDKFYIKYTKDKDVWKH